jgi:NAD(P)-dependent dehydrogenase (short-subunit alcohol dehydrogenase family)
LPQNAFAHQPDEAETAKALEAIRLQGSEAIAFPLDVRDEKSVASFHAAVTEEFGDVDILVNAAGVAAHSLICSDQSDEIWATVIDINLNGPYRTIRRCLEAMIDQRWGRIVNIGSTAGNVGYAKYSAYCASKSGLLGLSRAVALETAEYGITCNVIQPGQLDTVMGRKGSELRAARGEGGSDAQENLDLIAQQLPMKRLVTTNEVASLALFLCRDEAAGITAEAIDVAGGALW